MKRQVTSILLFSALLMGGASAFVSCTDHDSDASYEVDGSIADQLKKHADEFQGYINTLRGNITDLEGRINTLKTETDGKFTTVNADIAGLKASLKALETRLTTAEKAIKTAQSTADAAKTAADKANADLATLKTELINADIELQNQINAVKQLAGKNKENIDNLTNTVNSLSEKINTNTDNIKQNGEYIQQLVEMLNNLETQSNQSIRSLENLYNDLDGRLGTDEELLELVKKDQAKLEDVVEKLNTKLDNTVDKTNFDEVKKKVEENKVDIQSIKTDVQNIKRDFANKVSQADFDILSDNVSKLDAAYKKADSEMESRINTKINEIQEKLNELFNDMINMLTGIELQATESPISGYENFSFLGSEAHILGAYFGKCSDQVFLGDELIANRNEILIDNQSGENAGIIYATLNPSNVDFTNCTLKIVNSLGEEAPFTAKVKGKINHALKYGISRANNSNVYAIQVNLDKDNLEAAKTWTGSDVNALKDIAKNVLDKLRKPGETRLNIADAATTIAKTFNNRLTAYGLQAEQTYVDANNKETTRTITSKLSLAATAIEPLSYIFLQQNTTLNNLDLPSFPTIQSKLNFNDYKFNWTPIAGLGTVKTSVTLKGMPDLNKIKVTIDGKVATPVVNVEKAEIKFGNTTLKGTIDEDNKHITVDLGDLEKNTTADIKVSVGDIVIKPDDLHVTVDTSTKTDMTYDVEIPMGEFNNIINSINNQVGNMIGNVNNIVDKIQGYTETIDGKYITGINNFIQKFENLLRKSNSLLQPAMFYVTSNGSWGQLAREKEGASYLKLQGAKASTILVASSYTGEILAPAYKKYVHVTNRPAGAHVTGENLNKIIDGNLHKIGFEADKAGDYELTYEAVDYTGHSVSKTFWIKVVK